MADQSYYVRIKGRQAGPYALQRVQNLIRRGELSRIHEVSTDGQTWKSAADFPELFAAPEPARPVVPSGGQSPPAPPQSDEQWHYATGDERLGPVSRAQLMDLLARREISPATLVWSADLMGEWRPASDIPGLVPPGPEPVDLGAIDIVDPDPSGPSPITPIRERPDRHDTDDALGKVQAPALSLMVLTIIMMVLLPIGIVLNLLGIGLGAAAGPDQGLQAMLQGTVGLITSGIALASGIFIIVGCIKMKNLTSYGMAMAANIIAMVPCISPCCFLGLPIGLWGIIILNRPEVKQAFR